MAKYLIFSLFCFSMCVVNVCVCCVNWSKTDPAVISLTCHCHTPSPECAHLPSCTFWTDKPRHGVSDRTKGVEGETFPSSHCLWRCSNEYLYSFVTKKRREVSCLQRFPTIWQLQMSEIITNFKKRI